MECKTTPLSNKNSTKTLDNVTLKNWSPSVVALIMSMMFVMQSNSSLDNWTSILTSSIRTIEYTYTILRTFFQFQWQAHWLCFFTGPIALPKHNLTLPLSRFVHPLQIPYNSITHNYSILSKPSCNILENHVAKVASCSIAACKSISHVATDKVYHVLFDSGSSKTLINKHIVPHNLHLFNLMMTSASFPLLEPPLLHIL